MKLNEMLLNKLKIQSNYGEVAGTQRQSQQVVNGSKEYWGKTNQATEILERYKVPKTEENKQGIQAFMKNAEGDTQSKLETVEIAASNGVEMTENNLNSIHEAVNSDYDVKESIEVLVVEGSDSEGIINKSDIEQMELPAEMKEEIMADIENGTPPMKALAKALGEALGEEYLSKFSGKLTGDVKVTIRITIEVIEIKFKAEGADFDMDKLVEALKKLMNDKNDGVGTFIKSAAELIEALSSVEEKEGEEAIEASETEESPLEDQMLEWVTQALESVDAVAGNLMEAFNDSPGLKLYVVESVTVKMQEVAESFKAAQKSLVQNMDKVLSEDKPLSSAQMKEVLNTVVNKLDDLLMKSDVPLFTSMQMEKDLLKMSSDLQEARQKLDRGDMAGAKQIIKTVHGKLEAAVFKPSERKVQGFALKQNELFLKEKEFMQFQSYKQENMSSRHVLELFRSMGLNHEYEVSEKMAQLKSIEKEMKFEGNLKEVLYKLEQDEKQDNKAIETIEKSLNNLNGQQLLNKQSQKNNQQTMFFNIPFGSDQEVKNMKLYVNSRDADNRLDWENCSLYFVMDLKTYGPTGIKVDIKNRGVSITVKNDDERLKDIIEPLIGELGKAFEDVGLKEKDVHFLPLDDHKKFGRNMLKEKPEREEAKVKLKESSNEKKGFDVKI